MSATSSRSPVGVAEASARFDSPRTNTTRAWLETIRPHPPALILDIGAEATWLAAPGIDVFSTASPAGANRSSAAQWIDDRLPGLERTHRLGASFDFILLGEAWKLVADSERARAFRKIITLLKPGGRLAVVLNHGPSSATDAFAVRIEIEKLARDHGLMIEASDSGAETFTRISLRLPDDGTGALPVLRHIILNDSKSATYKLALLRVLCRIADGAGGLARAEDDEHVGVPLGLVALYWVRLFKPLLAADLPQAPDNFGDGRLGFVRDRGFRSLRDMSHLDLRVGAHIGQDEARALHHALRDAALHIERMPARFTTYTAGTPIFPIKRGPPPRAPVQSMRLDAAYLSGFGTMFIPRHLWRAFQRFDVWIEPSLTAEWKRLIDDYSKRQGRVISPLIMDAALKWSDPERDVRIARQRALQLLETRRLHCVWSGRTLDARSLDIDHCFPWSAWPCEDLWNLMPAHREVNQKQKRERLPSRDTLRIAHDRIIQWWQDSYLMAKDTSLPERFLIEARSTLPTLGFSTKSAEDVYSAVILQQARLKHDQQVPVWEPDQASA